MYVKIHHFCCWNSPFLLCQCFGFPDVLHFDTLYLQDVFIRWPWWCGDWFIPVEGVYPYDRDSYCEYTAGLNYVISVWFYFEGINKLSTWIYLRRFLTFYFGFLHHYNHFVVNIRVDLLSYHSTIKFQRFIGYICPLIAYANGFLWFLREVSRHFVWEK